MPGPNRRHGGPGSAPVEKPKDLKGSLKRMSKYVFAEKTKLFIVVLMVIATAVFGILAPKVLGKGMDILYNSFVGAINGQEIQVDFDAVGHILVILIVLYLCNSVFNYVQGYLMTGMTQSIIFKMRKEVMEKLSKLPIRYFDNHQRGDILSKMSNDIDNVGNSLQQVLVQIISSLITVIGVLAMMLYISPLLTLVVILTIPFLLVVTICIAKKSRKYFDEQWDTLGDLNSHIEEMFTGSVVVSAYGYEDKAIEKFRSENKKLYHSSKMAQFISGTIFPLMNCINNLGYVIICIIGASKVISGTMSFGDITAFIQYQKQFSQPITQMANMMNIVQSAMSSAERVFEILDEEEETERFETETEVDTVKGKVTFSHVSFGYTPDKMLIRDMNIEVKPGQMVAIVGPTGAGKTTLVNLLMRFYEIASGSITIDDVDIRDISREKVRDIFGMVLQDTWLFSGSIFDNIGYGSDNATADEIHAAAKAAHVDRFIKTLSEGYDTILNEEGTNVSQGQKQLLTIARAMISAPQILILDEATSSVDTRTEVLIQKAMEELLKGRTSFVIAHRLSTIRNADLILVMRDGDIVEQGRHDELMEQNGFYAELYNSQFTNGACLA